MYPSRVVEYRTPSATTGPVHRCCRFGEDRQCSVIGGLCGLGDMPARLPLLWKVGHTSFGGATISTTTKPVPDAFLFKDDVPMMDATWRVSSGNPWGTLTWTTIFVAERPGTSPTSGIPSPSVSFKCVTPSARNRRTVQPR